MLVNASRYGANADGAGADTDAEEAEAGVASGMLSFSAILSKSLLGCMEKVCRQQYGCHRTITHLGIYRKDET